MSAAVDPAEGPPPAPGPDTVITIDGPAGVGKSTTARFLAERYGLVYVDTGAMYRALTLAARRAGVAPDRGAALAELLRGARLELRPGRREAQVLWNGVDVSREIRTPEIDAGVSAVSAHAEVRRVMAARQRELGRRGGVVVEGRDIGSVVFPLAEVKIYLDASLEARTRRRLRQYGKRGREVDAEATARELADRDRRDSSRRSSPLTIPPDAVVLDSSDWSLEVQRRRVCAAVAGRLAQERPPVPARRDLPAKYRLAYAVMAAGGAFFGLRVHDRHRLEAAPPGTILAANHVSWWDPPIVGATFWRARVRTLAKAELFRPPPAGALFRWLDAVPIERSGYDHRAFDTAAAALRGGDDVFIFPEGTRRPVGEPGPVRAGLGILVQRTGAPFLPIFVRGTCALRPGGSQLSPLEVSFGPLVRPRALPALRERHEERQISALLARFFEAVLREMQARSWDRRPRTAWEEALGRRQAPRLRERQRRLFGPRAGGASGP